MSDFQKRLSDMQDSWEENSKKGFSNLKDGTYNVRLTNAALEESSKDTLQIHAEYAILSDENGEAVDSEMDTIHHFIGVEGEWGPSFVRRWLAGIGKEFPSDPSDLEEIVSSISDETPYLRVRLKTSKKSDFQGVTVLRVLEDDEIPQAAEADEEEEEKPKPSKPGKKPEPKEEEEEEEEEAPEDEEVEDLKRFCEANGIEIDEDENDKKAIVKAIQARHKKTPFTLDEMTADEVKFLGTIGIELAEKEEEEEEEEEEKSKPKKPAAGKEKEKPLSEKQLIAEACRIIKECTDVKAPKVPTVKNVKAVLDGYEWTKKETDPTDAKVLRQLGIEVA